MLAVKTYPQDYIDDCRAKMDAQLDAYKALVAAVGKTKAPAGRAAVETFEPLFFNNLVLVLDAYFMHRTRAIEGKDGNPLNEVRMLCTSILQNKGVLAIDKTIKYRPEASVSKLDIGDEIRVDQAQFQALYEAFFAELERRFT
jgi:hypothetical protein